MDLTSNSIFDHRDQLARKDAEIERLRAALKWYGDEAESISKKLHGKEMAKEYYAVEASLVVLALDGGKRARDALRQQAGPEIT